MAWSFNNQRPVYMQISEKLRMMIFKGECPPGSQLPTVRNLALEAAVNPNTVQRAFQDLEDEGLIVTKRTLGKYVTDDIALVNKAISEYQKRFVRNVISEARELMITPDYLIELIKEEYDVHS